MGYFSIFIIQSNKYELYLRAKLSTLQPKIYFIVRKTFVIKHVFMLIQKFVLHIQKVFSQIKLCLL